jgi:DNA polymerase-1
MKRIFLIDGNSFVYRAFFATPHLSNSKGMPTNAIYAFINMMKKLLNEQKPDGLAVIFDSKVPSFRVEISQEYKATRPAMPGNLSAQFPYIKTIVEKMGIVILEKEGFEADDVIATLVRRLEGREADTFVVTSDKDLMQLVCDRDQPGGPPLPHSVTIFDSMKNVMMKKDEVEAKFGIDPCLIPDFLALSGDTSDNIPGVPGIGDKTAKELVAGFGNIDEIYRRVDEVKKPAVRQKLIDNRERAVLSKQLATLRFDVPIDVGVEELKPQEPDLRGLRQIFRDLEFMSLYREIQLEETEAGPREASSVSELGGDRFSMVARISGRCAYDVTLSGFAIADDSKVLYSQNEDDLFSALSRARELVIHNLKPLFLQAIKRQTDLDSSLFDTMLAVYLINPARKDYGVVGILEEYLGADINGNDDRQSMVRSASRLGELKDVLLNRLDGHGLRDLFFNIEMPLVEVLAHMECLGVRVDRQALALLSRDFDARLNVIMRKIYDLAGEEFNINSPQQLVRILFDKLKLTPTKKTKKSYSTDNEVLQLLSEAHALPAEILEYRMLAKLKGTYIDALRTLIHQSTGRIHASFNQMVVATGRLSSNDPNLQNIPIKGVEGRKIREAFVPEEGYLLVSSDYSQIELRVLAHISGDELLADAFRRDEDIHNRVASEVFRVEPDMVTADMRRAAKVINFGIVYGMSGFGLSKELGVNPKEAQAYIDAYFERHRGIREYIEQTVEQVRETGFVRTLFGRIRYIPEIANPDSNVRQFGERTAINTPIQGTAADIIKMAMVNIYRRIKETGSRTKLIMQIHDELVFEVPEAEIEETEIMIRHEMEHVCVLAVPLKVTVGKGKNWALAHD